MRSVSQLVSRLNVSAEPGPVSTFFSGGTGEAKRRLSDFLDRIGEYEERRNEPSLDAASFLSPYLHFGQISELEIALECGARRFAESVARGEGRFKNQPGSAGTRTTDLGAESSREAFLEELLVRRSLSHNYVWYSRDYDRFDGLPDWARATLAQHRDDPREHAYSQEELVAASTHDTHWNHAMRQMKVTGYMHNYMRMYWGKKILEWSPSPEAAFSVSLDLNNRYFLDGRDANSYANVAWIFGLHDRPWQERAIYGKVRTMTAGGLERKFDMPRYHRKVQEQERRA